MAQKANPIDHTLATTALRLVAARGWEAVTVEAIAKAAKMPLAKIKARCADRKDLLPLLVNFITAESCAALGKPDKKSPPRDRLFEGLMARFDVLQTHRSAIQSIVHAVRRDRSAALLLAKAQLAAMKQTLAFAALDEGRKCAVLKPFVLYGVYLSVLRVWLIDETLDMSKTMAALDRILRYLDRAAILLRIE